MTTKPEREVLYFKHFCGNKHLLYYCARMVLYLHGIIEAAKVCLCSALIFGK